MRGPAVPRASRRSVRDRRARSRAPMGRRRSARSDVPRASAPRRALGLAHETGERDDGQQHDMEIRQVDAVRALRLRGSSDPRVGGALGRARRRSHRRSVVASAASAPPRSARTITAQSSSHRQHLPDPAPGAVIRRGLGGSAPVGSQENRFAYQAPPSGSGFTSEPRVLLERLRQAPSSLPPPWGRRAVTQARSTAQPPLVAARAMTQNRDSPPACRHSISAVHACARSGGDAGQNQLPGDSDGSRRAGSLWVRSRPACSPARSGWRPAIRARGRCAREPSRRSWWLPRPTAWRIRCRSEAPPPACAFLPRADSRLRAPPAPR